MLSVNEPTSVGRTGTTIPMPIMSMSTVTKMKGMLAREEPLPMDASPTIARIGGEVFDVRPSDRVARGIEGTSERADRGRGRRRAAGEAGVVLLAALEGGRATGEALLRVRGRRHAVVKAAELVRHGVGVVAVTSAGAALRAPAATCALA